MRGSTGSYVIFLVWMASSCLLVGQTTISGKLVNGRNNQPLAFAVLRVEGENIYTQTTVEGIFSLELSGKRDTVDLRIWAIGLDTLVSLPVHAQPFTIHLTPQNMVLDAAKVQGYTARGVVEKMIANLKSNYFRYSFGAAAFYRQYQKINDQYANLIEAKVVTLFKKKTGRDFLRMQELHAVGSVRKSARRFLFDDFRGDEYDNLFYKNPIYHLVNGSLDPHRFDDYVFVFDSVDRQGAYVIRYRCNDYSSENHGVDNHTELDRYGEASEEGRLVIEKNSFALIEFERKSIRNPYFNYPDNDNYLLPGKDYQLEFVNANLKINFTLKGDQYVMNRMLYWFANNYRNARLHTVDYEVKECFEWYAMKFSRKVSEAVLDKLGGKTNLVENKFPYKPAQWEGNLPELQFAERDQLEVDIRSFSRNGKLFRTDP